METRRYEGGKHRGHKADPSDSQDTREFDRDVRSRNGDENAANDQHREEYPPDHAADTAAGRGRVPQVASGNGQPCHNGRWAHRDDEEPSDNLSQARHSRAHKRQGLEHGNHGESEREPVHARADGLTVRRWLAGQQGVQDRRKYQRSECGEQGRRDRPSVGGSVVGKIYREARESEASQYAGDLRVLARECTDVQRLNLDLRSGRQVTALCWSVTDSIRASDAAIMLEARRWLGQVSRFARFALARNHVTAYTG